MKIYSQLGLLATPFFRAPCLGKDVLFLHPWLITHSKWQISVTAMQLQ